MDIRVTNYGIELREVDWERIFDETIRAETAKTVAIEGTGLGLYVCRKLIQIHQGEIKVECCEPTKASKRGISRWKTTFLISLKC